jgi:hypothetical protein
MTLYAIESQRFGLAKEAVRGTAETTPTKWYQTRGRIELNYALQHLEDMGIRGQANKFAPIAGIKVGDGKIPLYYDPKMMPEFFQGLLGTVASAEDSTITISNANKYIDFNIGGGDLAATVGVASYPIGTTSSETGTLCKAIKDALFAADATGTYTVSYSRSTKLFTIARSAGTLNIKFATGSNVANGIASTIGFAATDRTGAITYTGTVTVDYAFTHTITQSTSIQKQAFTFFVDRSLNVMKYNLGVVKALKLKGTVDGLVEADAEILFKAEASGSIGSPSFPTQGYLSFQHCDFKIAGSSNANVKEWELNINNSAQAHRTLSLSQDLQDILAAGKMQIDGSFMIYFDSATERDKFIANTAVALRCLAQGATIAGSSKYAIDINIYEARYKAFPYGEDQGLLAASVQFEGYYSTSDSKAIQVAITNQEVSY